jgi:hypothetical protein
MWHLRICDKWIIYFAICGFAIRGPNYMLRIQNFRKSAKIQKFSPCKYKLKMLSFKFKDDFFLSGQF